MAALTDEESDAMQMTFPVLVHGMLKTESFSGAIRPADTTGGFTFTVPEERRPEQSRLEIRYSPTLAGAMVDALPYLVDYPYGCTEQTLNRFLPAVLTQRTLQRMGVDLKDDSARSAPTSTPRRSATTPSAPSSGSGSTATPCSTRPSSTTIVKAGVNRLTEMQLTDGGWGWFSGWGEQSSAHTTAMVVRGLLIAQQNDVAIVPGVARARHRVAAALPGRAARGARQLGPRSDEGPRQGQAGQVARRRPRRARVPGARRSQQRGVRPRTIDADAHARMRDLPVPRPHQARRLQPRHVRPGPADRAGRARRNAADGHAEHLAVRRQDDENQTAWLDLPGGNWWYWYGSEYEAHAYYLKLLAAAEPKSEVAPRLVKYLLNNRKHATYWNSTRDTALVVEAFADYLTASGEAKPNMSLAMLDRRQAGARRSKITAENLFTFDNKLVLDGRRARPPASTSSSSARRARGRFTSTAT